TGDRVGARLADEQRGVARARDDLELAGNGKAEDVHRSRRELSRREPIHGHGRGGGGRGARRRLRSSLRAAGEGEWRDGHDEKGESRAHEAPRDHSTRAAHPSTRAAFAGGRSSSVRTLLEPPSTLLPPEPVCMTSSNFPGVTLVI